MKITMLFFGIYREITGKKEEIIEIPRPITVEQLLQMLDERYANFSRLEASTKVAVNQEFVDRDHPLQPGDTVAFIPPLGGGGEEKRFHIQETPLDPMAVLALVESGRYGATVLFVGRVRDHTGSREVEALYYEAYEDMAIKEMRAIGEEIKRKWPESGVAIHHRSGRLSVGEAAVVIAVGTPHRQSAFEACKFAIDRLKETVPIWKKEIFAAGSEWVGTPKE